jgi:hypothetical protein
MKGKLNLLDEFRLYICGLLLDFILWVVPEDTEDGLKLVMHIKQYTQSVIINQVNGELEE